LEIEAKTFGSPSGGPHFKLGLMRTTRQLCALLFIVFLTSPAFSGDTLELTWRLRKKGAEYNTLIWNQTEIPLEVALDYDRLEKFLKERGPATWPATIHVIFPNSDGLLPSFPRLPGNLALLFSSATAPDRKVEYTWKGQVLRRYCIRCSTKGTSSGAEAANYWLDGEFLGTWYKAHSRFMDFPWQKGAVVDIVFNDSHPFSSSGMPLSLLPELETLAYKHTLLLHQHHTFRKMGDR
jgi:hypothetical protein